MPTSFTNAQLIPHFTAMVLGSATATPTADLHAMLACLAAMPAAEYAVIDPQAGDDLPPGIYGLGPLTVIAKWHDPQQGYGDVSLLSTRAGPGLLFSIGGSTFSSAASVWVVPVQLLGWVM